MFTPDRNKIFEDIDANEECSSLACSLYLRPGNDPKKDLGCMATCPYQCTRVTQIAAEINQFIADNDDVFIYISRGV